MDSSLFENCKDLTEVTIPSTVESVRMGVFSGCTALEKIIFAGTKSQWAKVGGRGKTDVKPTEYLKYIITFHANDGSDQVSYQVVNKAAGTNEVTVDLAANEFTYDGYVFKEWNIKKDGSGKAYKDKSSITISDDTDLYAQWGIDISKAKVTPSSMTYNGSDQKPSEIIVKINSKALTEGEDYSLTWPSASKDAGTYEVKINGLGKYAGTATARYTITAKKITREDITVSPSSYIYDGTAKELEVTVKSGDKALTQGKDYSLDYKNNVNVGTATVTVAGKGNCTGNVTVDYSIAAKEITEEDITVSQEKYTYDGTAKEPAVTVKVGTKTLKKGTDYSLAYKNNVNPGTATVTVTGKGTYEGTVNKSFTITKEKAQEVQETQKAQEVPSTARKEIVAKVIAKGETAGVISWTSVSGADRYVVCGAKCGKTGYNVMKVLGAGKNTWTKKKLKENSKYKFFVIAQAKEGIGYRTIAKSRSVHFVTGNVRGNYTNARSLKLKKKSLTIPTGAAVTIQAKIKKAKTGKNL